MTTLDKVMDFLAGAAPDDIGVAPADVETGSETERIRDALREVIDPEIGINIIDLGLVYGIKNDGDGVLVTMTMTTPACPLGDLIKRNARQAIQSIIPGRAVEVRIVWRPHWTTDFMTDDAREMLGYAYRTSR